MNWLLDTCVISEARKKTPSPKVMAWLGQQEESALFLSAVTIGELHKGAARLDDPKRRRQLLGWIHHELAARAGIAIAWDQTNKADYLQALTEELQQPEQRRLDDYLKPFIRQAVERQSAYQTLLTLSGLGPGSALHGQPAAEQERAKPASHKIR